MSNEIQRHEMYKKLSRHVYYYGKEPCPKGTIPLYIHKNSDNGFFACAYKYQDRIVIAFRGTDDSHDKKNDLNMFINQIPEQTKDAIYFVKQMKEVIKRDYPGYKLDTTGQSLGGSLSQYVHVLEEGINESVTFQPYGVGHTLDKYFSKYESKNPIDKITNYCVDRDLFSGILSKTTQIGKCYELDIKPERKNMDDIWKYHKIENLEPLSTRRYKNNGYMSKNKKLTNSLHSQRGCVGSYQVAGYTRADGTEVKSYTRACGAKHAGMSEEERIAGQNKYNNKKFQDIPENELEEAISFFI